MKYKYFILKLYLFWLHSFNLFHCILISYWTVLWDHGKCPYIFSQLTRKCIYLLAKHCSVPRHSQHSSNITLTPSHTLQIHNQYTTVHICNWFWWEYTKNASEHTACHSTWANTDCFSKDLTTYWTNARIITPLMLSLCSRDCV